MVGKIAVRMFLGLVFLLICLIGKIRAYEKKDYQEMIHTFLSNLDSNDYMFVDAFAFYDVFSLNECKDFVLLDSTNYAGDDNFSPVYVYRDPYVDGSGDSTDDDTEEQDTYKTEKAISTFLPLGTLSSTFSTISAVLNISNDGNINYLNNKIPFLSNCNSSEYGSDALKKMKINDDMLPTYLDIITGRFAYPMDFASNAYYNMYFPLTDDVYTTTKSQIIKGFLRDADIPSPYTDDDSKVENSFYNRPPVFNEYNQLLLDISISCTGNTSGRDARLNELAGSDNYRTFENSDKYKEIIFPGRDVSATLVSDKNNSENPNGKTYYPMYSPVASYILPATDIYMNMLGIASAARAIACGGKYSTGTGSKTFVPFDPIFSILSPVYRIEAGDYIGTGIGMGFYEKNINGYDIWISDGNWPGWNNRLGIYIPQSGVGDVIIFFIQTNIKKNNKVRDAFTEYTVRKLISSTNVSNIWYRPNNPWKNHGNGNETKRFDGFYEPIRSIKKYVLSSRLRIDDSIQFFDNSDYVTIGEGTYSESVPGILTPKYPLNTQINLIAFPDAANTKYLIYGRDALVKQGTEGLDSVAAWQYYVLLITIIACVGILVGEIIFTVRAYKQYAPAMKENKKLKKLEKSKMQKAKDGLISTDAGAALSNTGLMGGVDDLMERDNMSLFDDRQDNIATAKPKKFPINNFVMYVVQSSIVLACIIMSFTTLIIIFVESNENNVVNQEYGIYKYGLCEETPSTLYAIPALDIISIIAFAALFAFYGMQIYFYGKETHIIWLILVPISGAFILVWFIWGAVWDHFSIAPSNSIKCVYNNI